MRDTFDELSRALARGVSRREALKIFGVGVAGSLLALVGLGRASAQETCAQFCAAHTSNDFQQGNCRNVCGTCPGGPNNTVHASHGWICTGGSKPSNDWGG
jgi:hypothetical protein